MSAPAQYPHEELAILIACMDGRTAMTDTLNDAYQQIRTRHGQAFRLFWGGGPMLFLDETGREFAEQHFLLAHAVNPFTHVYGAIHMSCGAYAALLERTYPSREAEIESKWNDIEVITDIIHGLIPSLTVDIRLLDVDGTFLVRTPAEVDPLPAER